MRTYSRTRAWTADQFDAATERLERRGLVADGAFTERGRALREQIEEHTDAQARPLLDALGDDIGVLCDLLAPWSVAIREQKGYPASGPHDLARPVTTRTEVST